MFTAALLTTAKTCSSIDEWIKKMGMYVQWNTTHQRENPVICNMYGP